MALTLSQRSVSFLETFLWAPPRNRPASTSRYIGNTISGTDPRPQLVTILNDVSLRNLIPAELAQGFGFFVSKPSTAFAPFAVTPDELGEAWIEGRVHLPLVTHYNGTLFGQVSFRCFVCS